MKSFLLYKVTIHKFQALGYRCPWEDIILPTKNEHPVKIFFKNKDKDSNSNKISGNSSLVAQQNKFLKVTRVEKKLYQIKTCFCKKE